MKHVKKIYCLIMLMLCLACSIAQPPIKQGAIIPSIQSPVGQIVLGAAQNILIDLIQSELLKKNKKPTTIFGNNDIGTNVVDTLSLLDKINKRAATSFYKSLVTDIQLSSFNVQSFARFNNILWSTNNEKNVGGYFIERSTDCITFYCVGTMVGGNNSSVQQYSFTDTKINDTSNYSYRLKIIGANAQVQYSATLAINKRKDFSGVAYSIDTTTKMLQINSSLIISKIQIMNEEGKAVVTNKKINLIKPIDLSTLPIGNYTLKVFSGNNTMSQLFFSIK